MEYADFKIPVQTADGHRVGTLSGVEGPFMRVDRGWWRRNLWIPTEYVQAATAREVVLAFSECSINRYARPQRPALPQPVEVTGPEAAWSVSAR